MRTKSHVLAMLATAAATLSSARFLGAEQMKLPALEIPSLSVGGARAKPGKHRRSGMVPGAGPKNRTTSHRDHGLKMAAKRLARGQAGDDREWRKRMAWNETVYPRVLELQRQQRERSR